MWAGIDCNNFCQNDNDVVESLNTFILGKKGVIAKLYFTFDSDGDEE